MLHFLTLYSIRAEVRGSAVPLLVACVHAHADTAPHLRALEQVAETFGPRVKVCLLRERRLAALHDLVGVDGPPPNGMAPAHLLFYQEREVGRILGRADAPAQ